MLDNRETQLPIGERFKFVLNELGLNQKEFCAKAGIEVPTFNRVFNGHAMPRFDLVQSVYNAFPQISAHFLLSGSGPVLGGSSSKTSALEQEIQHLRQTLDLKDKIIALLEAGSKRAADGE